MGAIQSAVSQSDGEGAAVCQPGLVGNSLQQAREKSMRTLVVFVQGLSPIIES